MRNLKHFAIFSAHVVTVLFFVGVINARDRKIKEQEQEIKQLKEWITYRLA